MNDEQRMLPFWAINESHPLLHGLVKICDESQSVASAKMINFHDSLDLANINVDVFDEMTGS